MKFTKLGGRDKQELERLPKKLEEFRNGLPTTGKGVTV